MLAWPGTGGGFPQTGDTYGAADKDLRFGANYTIKSKVGRGYDDATADSVIPTVMFAG